MTRRKLTILIAMGLAGGLLGAVIDMTKDLIPGIVWKNTDKGSVFAFVFIASVAAVMLTYIWLNDTDGANKK